MDTATKLQFRLLAYCLMPDHLHVLLQGETEHSDLLCFVQRFKQVTSFYFKQTAGVQLWQQSFHDRVLRRVEEPEVVARYIFENPVADGLAAGSAAYLLRGGDYYARYVGSDGAEASSLRAFVPTYLSFLEEE